MGKGKAKIQPGSPFFIHLKGNKLQQSMKIATKVDHNKVIYINQTD